MNNETRRDIKNTFNTLDTMLSQASSALSLVKLSQRLLELLCNVKDYLNELNEERLEISQDNDFRDDIIAAREAIEECLSELLEKKARDEALNKAKVSIRKVTEVLKGWAD